MNRPQTPPSFPLWLVLLLVIIFIPRLLPLALFVYVLWQIGVFRHWRDYASRFRPKGFDISRFQKDNTGTKATSSSRSFSSYFSPMDPFRPTPKLVLSFLGVLIVAFIIIDGLVSVPAGHVAVIYDRGRGVLENEMPEGLHLKIPFWQVATIMDTRLQAYTMSVATYEGQLVGDDSIEALTKDGQKVDVDLTIQYRIQAQNASDIVKNIGSITDLNEKVIRPEVRSVVREVITGYESKQLFSLESRQKSSLEMQNLLKEQYKENNVILDSLLLRNVRFSQVYLNAIEEKQVAEQKIQKAEFEKQEAEKRAERTIIEATAEAEAIRLRGEALSQNPEVIQLEFVNKMAPEVNWGILPDGAIPLLDLNQLQ